MLFIGSIISTNLYLFIFGKFFSEYFLKDKSLSRSEKAIYGCILVSFLGLIINFFLPLNKVINSVVFLTPILFVLKKKFFLKNDFIFIIISSILVLILISFSHVNRPDAGLYHLPFTQILNESKLIVGLSNLHFRFGHISIQQYLSAINYNFIGGKSGITIPLASFISFLFIYFYNEVLKFFRAGKLLKLENLFSLFVLIYISFKINRYSGFGNDAPAHLITFYLISVYLKSINNYNFLNKISILSTYVFINKITLSLVFLFPIIIFLKIKKKFKIFFSFSFFILFFWLLKNILTSSCLVYPINKTCFEVLPWNNKNEIIKQSISAEAWSKGWPERINKSITFKEFLNDFNWIETWSTKHLIYIINILIPYMLFLILIIITINLNRKKNLIKFILSKDDNFKLKSSILITLLGSLFFFLKFPLYRYGYSYLISLIIFLNIILIFKYDLNTVKKIFKYVFICSLIIMFSKQLLRIISNYNSYNIEPNIYSFKIGKYNSTLSEININENFKIYRSNSECMYSKAPCTNILNKKINYKKIFGYDVLSITKN